MIKKIAKSRNLTTLFLLIVFLVFFKIDFRFAEGIFCCGDDHDYYSHAATLVDDFDFDYSNQLEGHETRRFNLNGKIAPKGFFGSGLLASPFLLIGSLIETIFNFLDLPINNFMNYRLLIYSLSSTTYFFATVFLLSRIFELNKIKVPIITILLFLGSSGIVYYAFERFSMTPVYEAFTTTLVFYFTNKFYLSKNSTPYAILVSISLLLAVLVKLTNYYVFLIPMIVKYLLTNTNNKSIYKNYYFLISAFFSILIFMYLSLKIYGLISFNPETLYGQTGVLKNYFAELSISDLIFQNIKYIFFVIFGIEFGIIWFSPILFFGPLLMSYVLFKKKQIFKMFILLIPFMQCMAIVLLWRSTASSYGFRYLFSLAPLAIIYYFFHRNIRSKRVEKTVLIFSLFSMISILFFETTLLTQLSLEPEMNSFGRNIRYVEPNYLIGYVLSIFEIQSYLKIFTTSFLGVLFFKLLSSLFIQSEIVNFLDKLGLPVGNEDFINFLYEVEMVSFLKILIIVAYFYFVTTLLLSKQKTLK